MTTARTSSKLCIEVSSMPMPRRSMRKLERPSILVGTGSRLLEAIARVSGLAGYGGGSVVRAASQAGRGLRWGLGIRGAGARGGRYGHDELYRMWKVHLGQGGDLRQLWRTDRLDGWRRGSVQLA